MLTRREVLKRMTAGTALAAAPGLVLANADTQARFVLVILRGAADGLAIAAAYADPHYARQRGGLALSAPGDGDGLLDLDGFFGLHPRLALVHELYGEGQVRLLHAVASPYRERSHFDGQDVLENGGSRVGALRDGWLNRALKPLGGGVGEETAIALAANTPLVLRGAQSTTSWAPSRLPGTDGDTLERLSVLYRDDAFFSERFAQAMSSQAVAGALDMGGDRRGRRGPRLLTENLRVAASFLTAAGGPRIAVVESGGWDTHANQGTANGALANQLAALDAGLGALRSGLGQTWSHTAVAVVTEFGRTVSVNGTRGTDHGTASAALLLGGAVNGGITTDWPGLGQRALYEGRDLKPTMDLRSVFKSILSEHLEIPERYVQREVFPDSNAAAPLKDLFKG